MSGAPTGPAASSSADLASTPAPAATRVALEPGDIIDDKYRVEGVIGHGGMGLVLHATHLQLREPVALKFMNAETVENPEAAARFVREARAAARLRGEHVCRVLDMGETSAGDRYIVIEYLEGRDLADILAERGPLPVAEAVDYILQACEAMAEAHAAGIVHRDLKPANLFLTTGTDGAPCIKVLDFGISKLLEPGTSSQAVVTTTRSLMGSPLYMAPEQLVSAKDVDPRADIWALGTVLYQLISGATPYEGNSLPEVVAQVLHTDPPRISTRVPGAPKALDAALARCLRKDPAKRYPTVAELAADLAELVPESSHLALRSAAVLRARRAGSVVGLPTQPRTWRRAGPLAVASALLAAGIILIVAWALRGGGDAAQPSAAPAPPPAADAAVERKASAPVPPPHAIEPDAALVADPVDLEVTPHHEPRHRSRPDRHHRHRAAAKGDAENAKAQKTHRATKKAPEHDPGDLIDPDLGGGGSGKKHRGNKSADDDVLDPEI